MACAAAGSPLERWLRADYAGPTAPVPRRRGGQRLDDGTPSGRGRGLLGVVRALLVGTRG